MTEPVAAPEESRVLFGLETKGKSLRSRVVSNPEIENDTVLDEMASWVAELVRGGYQQPEAIMLVVRAAVGYKMTKPQLLDVNHIVSDMGETAAKRPLADKVWKSGTRGFLKLVSEQMAHNFQRPEDVLACRHDAMIASELAERVYKSGDYEMVFVDYRKMDLVASSGQKKEGLGHRVLQIRSRRTGDGPIIDATNHVVKNSTSDYRNYWENGEHWQTGTGRLAGGEWYAISKETGMETRLSK